MRDRPISILIEAIEHKQYVRKTENKPPYTKLRVPPAYLTHLKADRDSLKYMSIYKSLDHRSFILCGIEIVADKTLSTVGIYE